MHTHMVRAGYDKMARDYLAKRAMLKTDKYLRLLLKQVPKKSMVLDLGCGAGKGVDEIILKAGHEVRGLDISPKQIELAKQYCPGASYMVGDICQLKRREYQAQAIVCLYVMFHLPRIQHLRILQTMASFLPRQGLLLITMGDREFEGEHILHGQKMWSSQYGTIKNRELVEQAGFTILRNELDQSGGERHQVILAEKRD